MRNFKDFTRAIAGIASALKGINTVVDDIPVPGGSTLPEWTLVSASDPGYDTLSTTATEYTIGDYKEFYLNLFCGASGFNVFLTPVYIPVDAFQGSDSYVFTFSMKNNADIQMYIYIDSGKLYVQLTASVSDTRAYVYAR